MNDQAYGIEGMSEDDRRFTGSRFSVVRDAIFANPYQKVWGAAGAPPFERFATSFGSVMVGAFRIGKSWVLLDAAKRTLASFADLRWGADGKGYKRLLHPNGICLTGMWEITEQTQYSGYFAKGSRGLVIARYSTCCTETRRGRMRSLAMVGRLYPTTDQNHSDPLPTASFITQQDIAGEKVNSINEALLLNAPNTTPLRRGLGAPVLMATGIALKIAETQPTIRQVYEMAELGKPEGEPTWAPEFMQFRVAPEHPVIPGDDLDFRDEIMAQIYDRGDATPKRKLVFRVETSDCGTTHGSAAFKEWRNIKDWRAVGTVTFDAACASINGDRVLHFHHPRWRKDRNDPRS
jgi:hypothetical protein